MSMNQASEGSETDRVTCKAARQVGELAYHI